MTARWPGASSLSARRAGWPSSGGWCAPMTCRRLRRLWRTGRAMRRPGRAGRTPPAGPAHQRPGPHAARRRPGGRGPQGGRSGYRPCRRPARHPHRARQGPSRLPLRGRLRPPALPPDPERLRDRVLRRRPRHHRARDPGRAGGAGERPGVRQGERRHRPSGRGPRGPAARVAGPARGRGVRRAAGDGRLAQAAALRLVRGEDAQGPARLRARGAARGRGHGGAARRRLRAALPPRRGAPLRAAPEGPAARHRPRDPGRGVAAAHRNERKAALAEAMEAAFAAGAAVPAGVSPSARAAALAWVPPGFRAFDSGRAADDETASGEAPPPTVPSVPEAEDDPGETAHEDGAGAASQTPPALRGNGHDPARSPPSCAARPDAVSLARPAGPGRWGVFLHPLPRSPSP